MQARLARPAQAVIQQPTANAQPTMFPRNQHAQRAHALAMLRLDPQIAHDEVFRGRNQHAACSLLDRFQDAGLALSDVKSGFRADAVTFGRDGGEQCDDAWHIDGTSSTNENARKHDRQYDVHASGRRYIGRDSWTGADAHEGTPGNASPDLEGFHGYRFRC